MVETFTSLEDALAAKTEGFVVSGVYRHAQLKRERLLTQSPDLFFLAPADADDETMRNLSHEAVTGQPLSDDEVRYRRALKAKAEEMHRDGLL